MPTVLVPLAQGCEELEAVTIVDILRRAGVDVVTAGLDKTPVKASRGVTIIPDMTLDEALKQNYDMVALPGGLPGADNLNNDTRIHDLLKKMAAGGKFTAAICAAPVVLAKAGLLKGKKATSYPGFLDKMALPGVTFANQAVVKDGKVITSRGPGTAMDFALELVESLCGAETRKKVESGLVRT
ncbi:MAG: DJ-1/PfpI family protein [Candidatus Hydrogenedentes bacterium]|nr:DJ-1/PfpI family protein [Candidatus Hydrogenedentota bacterium]